MNAQDLSGLLVGVLAVTCIVIVLSGLKKVLSRMPQPDFTTNNFFRVTVVVLLGWMALMGLLALNGVFAAPGLPPRPMFAVVPALAALLVLSFTKNFKQVLIATPLHWLVYFQAFRIGVELWFWYSYQASVFPKIMTFEGANLDIIAGAMALPAGWAVQRWRHLQRLIATVFNIAGIIILLNTLKAAALSMPSPIQQYPFDERLLLLGTFPFIYLPGVLVVLALGGHILSLRQVNLKKRATEHNEKHGQQVRLHQSV